MPFIRHQRAVLFVLIIGLLVACSGPNPQPPGGPSPTPAVAEPTADIQTPGNTPVATIAAEESPEQPIYLAIIWHQHQPVYFKDPDTGVYIRPWVRVHATKDYVDMATTLAVYPDVHATFNLTPSLIRQLDDLGSGAKDAYWVYAEIPANNLTLEQKQFLLDRFFDTNSRIINRFPRYQELLTLRNTAEDPLVAFTTQDYLDLQVLFNLAWTDPDWLELDPLRALVEKGQNYEEADKPILFAEHLRLIQEVIPVHRELQDAGQIEVTMTPYAHPILPLLVTTDLAREALPDIQLPGEKFVFGQDAAAQVALGVRQYEAHFGRPPRGMWPAEGSVAQEIVTMVAQNGIQWMASDEGVLASSLGIESFARDSAEVVIDADQLYRPYYVEGTRGEPVAMVFRDIVISDKVGFTYSGLEGEAAAADFIDRIHAIREKLIDEKAPGPHLVSVILDGENAWEYYENDGKVFLHSLYRALSADPLIKTVTPSEFLEIAPDQPRIEDLWAGSWISHDFSTWIGEEEENTAWELLAETRTFLQTYISGDRQGTVSEAVLENALTQMYIAEGSDWFWWYGADQDSGNDTSFDQQFRSTLGQVYLALGAPPPAKLEIPIIPEQPVTAERPVLGLLAPVIDGVAAEGEWAEAGLYRGSGGVMAAGQAFFEEMVYGFDAQNLYLAFQPTEGYQFPSKPTQVEIYLNVPGAGPSENFTRAGSLLGFRANRMAAVMLVDGVVSEARMYTAGSDGVWQPGDRLEQVVMGELLEMAIPIAQLGGADTGDRITMKSYFNEIFGETPPFTYIDLEKIPPNGPAQITLPDLGTTTVVLDIQDPEGDDYGPGTYVYPEDSVFVGGVFDLLNFQAGFDEENIVFKFVMRGPVENVWSSPNGLSVQTFDIYLDKDGDGDGGKAMLPGRNLAFQDGYAWDLAVSVEGWTSGIYKPGEEGPIRIAEASEFTVLVDPGQRRVTLRIPKSIMGDDPENWQFAAVVLSQEGYPSGGVMRVRDVLPVAEQWRIGGALPEAANSTRVLDLVWAEAGEQEGWLSDFTPSTTSQTALTAEDFARVPMIEVESQ